MQHAIDMVRRELGPEATVLHTRELHASILGRIFFGKQYEVAAAADADTPSRIATTVATAEPQHAAALDVDYRERYREDFRALAQDSHDEWQFANSPTPRLGNLPQVQQLSDALFDLYTQLIEADLEDRVAQNLIEHLRSETTIDLNDFYAMRAELLRLVEGEIRVTGPLEVAKGEGRVVALVGPTGVGKTTTIAKLAANYRLRENKSVGLITVDTYRIAAVEQLRTYAEIIDLPMEVVSTPREMREAISRMKSLDLILMDTAGRSPRDEVRIQELKAMLAEANPAEVHLVLSATAGARSLTTAADRFAAAGTTSLIITKLDEAIGLGNLLSVVQSAKLPITYITDGQNVPDDIQIAQKRSLAQQILNLG